MQSASFFHGRMRYSRRERAPGLLDGIGGGMGDITNVASSILSEDDLGLLWLKIRANVQKITDPEPWVPHTGLLQFNSHNLKAKIHKKKQ